MSIVESLAREEPLRRRRRAAELERLVAGVAGWVEAWVDRESGPAGELPGDAEELAAGLDLRLGGGPLGEDEVLERLRRVLAATPSSSSWRFLNQLFGGRVAVATAAELAVALPNISMYTFKAAGAQVLVEREVLRHMLATVGFADGEGCFTPGGSLANLVAMVLARNELAPEVRDRGLTGAPMTIYTSEESHYSFPKNAGILGLGRDSVRRIPVDGSGRMQVDALAHRIATDRERGLRPMLVNATAGTTVRGAFDPLVEIAPVAREAGVWLHVDGALGGSLVLCHSHRDELRAGLEHADSFAWNAHKMMGVPLQCSVLLVARRGALTRSLDETADYLFQGDEEDLDPGHRSLLCGRRNDALKLWAAWLQLGDEGWNQRLLRQLALARRAAERIADDPGLELVEPPPSINVCFRVRGRSSAAVCEKLDREGRLKIGHGTIEGRRAIRLVCVNPELDDEDLAAIFEEIKAAAADLPESEDLAESSRRAGRHPAGAPSPYPLKMSGEEREP